jgi:hypothetical protein
MKNMEPKLIVAALLKQDVPGLLSQTDGVINGLETQAALYPNSGPVVQGLKDARKALGDKKTTTGPLKRSAKARSAEEKTLRNLMGDAARFVQTCANNDPENGPAIIAASTFTQVVKKARTKAPLTLKYSPSSGTILADAKAAKRGRSAFYSWRFSLDGGATWVEVAQTNKHKTLLSGLPVGKTVLVQVAITQQDVRSSWSDSASILVH